MYSVRVFIKNKETNFTYPDDMKKILDYLNSIGKILVSDSTIEELYYKFSDKEYCAGWVTVKEETLIEFADWLDKIEL